jgi:CheY-like chemotaxis protein
MKNPPLLPAPRVLLVDDNRDGLTVRKLLLEEIGCHVEIAGDGEEALEIFASTNFDVVVTDYRMPRMNGTELIAHLRALKPETPIILLSGFVEPLGLNEDNTGADAVIAKSSVEPAHLVRSVKRLAASPVRRKPAARQTAERWTASYGNLSH